MSFIAIKTPAGDWLDIGVSTQLPFELETPIGKFETVPADRINNFKLPNTPKNDKALGYPSRLQNRAPFNRLLEGYELWMGGKLYAVGVIFITRNYTGYIDISFNFSAGRIAAWKDYPTSLLNLGIYNLPALSGATLENYMKTVSLATVADYDFVFAPITHTGGIPSINSYNTSSNNFSISALLTPYVTPYFYVTAILKNLSIITGLRHTGAFVNDAEIKTLCFYSPITVDNTLLQSARYLPEMTVAELYKELSKMFCLALFFSRDGDFVELKPIKDILSNPAYVDYTSFASEQNEVEFLKEKGVKLVQENDTNDAEVLQSQYYIEYGQDPKTEYTTAFSYPKSTQDGTYRYTTVSQPYEWDEATEDRPGFTPRLFFYRGYQLTSGGLAYPYMSFDDQSYGPSTIPNTNYILSWDGSKGLYNVWWKDFAQFISSTLLVTVKVNLSLYHIFTFDFSKKIKIGPYFFLPKTLKFTAGSSGLSTAELTLYRI